MTALDLPKLDAYQKTTATYAQDLDTAIITIQRKTNAHNFAVGNFLANQIHDMRSIATRLGVNVPPFAAYEPTSDAAEAMSSAFARAGILTQSIKKAALLPSKRRELEDAILAYTRSTVARTQQLEDDERLITRTQEDFTNAILDNTKVVEIYANSLYKRTTIFGSVGKSQDVYCVHMDLDQLIVVGLEQQPHLKAGSFTEQTNAFIDSAQHQKVNTFYLTNPTTMVGPERIFAHIVCDHLNKHLERRAHEAEEELARTTQTGHFANALRSAAALFDWFKPKKE